VAITETIEKTRKYREITSVVGLIAINIGATTSESNIMKPAQECTLQLKVGCLVNGSASIGK
jgi:hypothetical protein